MGEDLGGILVRFQHHGAETAGLDGGNSTADVLECRFDILSLAGLTGLFDDGRGELEGVGDGVDDGLGHFE